MPLAHAELVDVRTGGATTAPAGVACVPDAVSAADLWAALADEIGRLNEEGRGLQVLAARLARDTRPEFEAWFEAGLLLRRASARLAAIAHKLI
jgi:hypothetical protein